MRSVRLTWSETEYAAVAAAAARTDMAVGAYAAATVLAVATGADPPAWSPLRELLAEVVRASGQTRRIGVNLNQAVAALHALGRPTYALEQYGRVAARAVDNLDETAEQIRRTLADRP
ncbi:hypothetical protein [Actinomadura atramentaria]|uniref:hypothetical protein n=1 Tax=Actinomadura atramentaria TaxID=1990 RepID=UPI00146B880D|nr:hypothetical protein [Actinomadura atramentaria]